MIKIRLRRNLKYLFLYFMYSLLEKNTFDNIFRMEYRINPFYEKLYLFSFANIFGGLSIYLYQTNSLKKKEKLNISE